MIFASLRGEASPRPNISDLSLSRLKTPMPYPVVFSGVVFCLRLRMGESGPTGLDSCGLAFLIILFLAKSHGRVMYL